MFLCVRAGRGKEKKPGGSVWWFDDENSAVGRRKTHFWVPSFHKEIIVFFPLWKDDQNTDNRFHLLMQPTPTEEIQHRVR